MHLLSGFESNRTVLDLTISGIRNLEGEGTAALGSSLCTLLQYNSVLQRLKYRGSLSAAGILALQPGLRTNQTLKELHLPFCGIGNDGIRLLAGGLVGNATLKVLDIRNNRITSTALVDISRMIASTRLEKVDAGGNSGILNDDHHAQLFAAGLRPHLRELILTGCRIGDKGIRPPCRWSSRKYHFESFGYQEQWHYF
jgi:Leucine Rich repeat